MAIDFSNTLLFEGNTEVCELKTENHKLSTLNVFLFACLIVSSIIIYESIKPNERNK